MNNVKSAGIRKRKALAVSAMLSFEIVACRQNGNNILPTFCRNSQNRCCQSLQYRQLLAQRGSPAHSAGCPQDSNQHHHCKMT